MRVFRPILAAGVLALSAAPGYAQDDRFASADLRAGYGVMTGEAKDSLKSSTIFGAGLAVPLTDRFRIGVALDWGTHEVKPLTSPVQEWSLIQAFLRLSYDVVVMPKWTVQVNAGPGLMAFGPNELIEEQRGAGTDVHFGVNGGGSITYWFAERIGFLFSPQVNVAFKKTDGEIFREKAVVVLPISGGLRFKI